MTREDREADLADRRWAVASASGSLRAEGLETTPEYARDARDYADGVIDADELRRRTLARYRPGSDA
ncbi:MAG: antitoxin VbhA family protein [Streptomycetaceae bacterium]|nr:antitoxin VbhA family protein [Streptomycetaceae bacterium]